MTITELLSANPGVELTLAYNDVLGVFSVKARNILVTFNAVTLKTLEDREPGRFEDAIKRAMEAVR
mgnify:CR=1 FL=1